MICKKENLFFEKLLKLLKCMYVLGIIFHWYAIIFPLKIIGPKKAEQKRFRVHNAYRGKNCAKLLYSYEKPTQFTVFLFEVLRYIKFVKMILIANHNDNRLGLCGFRESARLCMVLAAYERVSKSLTFLQMAKVNFSHMSPKLVRTWPHIVENRRITMAPLFLRLISWKTHPQSI